jgi:hypothetical protein
MNVNGIHRICCDCHQRVFTAKVQSTGGYKLSYQPTVIDRDKLPTTISTTAYSKVTYQHDEATGRHRVTVQVPYSVTVDCTDAQLRAIKRNIWEAGAEMWVEAAAAQGFKTRLIGLPEVSLNQVGDPILLALVDSSEGPLVLTLSNPEGDSHTIRARPATTSENRYFDTR